MVFDNRNRFPQYNYVNNCKYQSKIYAYELLLFKFIYFNYLHHHQPMWSYNIYVNNIIYSND